MALLAPAAVHAQPAESRRDPQTFVNQQRALEEQLWTQFDAETPLRLKTYFDYGGWYSRHVSIFDDGIESSRTLRRHDLRLWSRLRLDQGAHEWYVRVRGTLIDFNSGDSYDGDDDDSEGPNLERGYYRFDLARALAAGTERGPRAANLVLLAGRDLVRLGNGLTLATPLDHVSLTASYRDFELRGLAGRSVGSSVDFDLTRTARRTRRAFFGAEARYLGFERHEPFAYALWQRDHHREARHTPGQEFDYDSCYVGLGAVGELMQNLTYRTEWVLQSGRSHPRTGARDAHEIRAWALDTELEYLVPGPRRARVSLAYLFGSGDQERTVSPSDSGGAGQLPRWGAVDSTDSGFNGFGYRNTGLALAPRYSNLHQGRCGASFFPWPRHTHLRDLQLGTDWFLYHKHHRAAAISDPVADVPSGYVGWEMDYYANWALSADVVWTARIGAFFPGSAYTDRTTRTFVLFGITWSF